MVGALVVPAVVGGAWAITRTASVVPSAKPGRSAAASIVASGGAAAVADGWPRAAVAVGGVSATDGEVPAVGKGAPKELGVAATAGDAIDGAGVGPDGRPAGRPVAGLAAAPGDEGGRAAPGVVTLAGPTLAVAGGVAPDGGVDDTGALAGVEPGPVIGMAVAATVAGEAAGCEGDGVGVAAPGAVAGADAADGAGDPGAGCGPVDGPLVPVADAEPKGVD